MKRTRSAIEQIEFMRNLLAFLLVGAFVAFGGVLLWHEIPEKNEQLLSYMLGQVSGMALMALGFYFVNKVGQDALDATRADNTGKMADLAKKALDQGGAADTANRAADQVADAASDEADEIRGDRP